MPLTSRESKDKSARLDWGYHARRSGFAVTRRRLWLLAAALVLPAVGVTVYAAATGQPPAALAAAASRGPLASPHAAWDNQCEVCHTPFRPINSAGWFDRLTGHPTGPAERCEQCHAAPAHHPAQKADEVARCGDCHRDHQGRDRSLVRLADATCTGCHADLAAHHADPARRRVAAAVTGFARPGGHPEFRNNPNDTPAFRRTLRFDHAVHLAPSRMMGRPALVGQMSDADRRRYEPYLAALKGADPSALCAACHQLDPARPDGIADTRTLSLAERFAGDTRAAVGQSPVEALLAPRPAGGVHLPINFEAHCRACHPLTFDDAPGLAGLQVPHRVATDGVERFLRQAYTERFVADGLDSRTEPTRGPARLDPPPAAVEAVRPRIEDAVRTARRRLLLGGDGCSKCHTPEYPEVVPAGADPRLPAGFAPTSIPTVWQPRARFDHTAHRAMNCKACHPGAYEERWAGEDYQRPPDLPTAASCQRCHAPAGGTTDTPTGGVRHGCTDCHIYHHVDRRLQGRGSPARRPERPLDDLLRGR